jgi:hypothetical protein
MENEMVVITAIVGLIVAAIVGLIAFFIALPLMAYGVYLAERLCAVQFPQQRQPSNG